MSDEILPEPDPPDKAKRASVATRKFDFEDIVNADPKCPPAALKIVRAYLPFVTDFAEPVYRSILDLMVDTALSNRHIIDTRKKLVELKYFIEDSRTATGAVRYRLSLADAENRVLNHQMIARETLRRLEAERKEHQRAKRRSTVSEDTSRPHAEPVSEDTSRPLSAVSEDSSRTESSVPCNIFTDVSEDSSRNYLENNLEGLGTEEEGYTRRSPVREGKKVSPLWWDRP